VLKFFCYYLYLVAFGSVLLASKKTNSNVTYTIFLVIIWLSNLASFSTVLMKMVLDAQYCADCVCWLVSTAAAVQQSLQCHWPVDDRSPNTDASAKKLNQPTFWLNAKQCPENYWRRLCTFRRLQKSPVKCAQRVSFHPIISCSVVLRLARHYVANAPVNQTTL